MYSVRPDGNNLARVPYEPGGYYAALAYWSRDGKRLFVPIERERGGEALVVDVRTGAQTRVLVHAVGGAAWSPAGSRIAVAGESGIVLVDADGSNRHQLTRDPNDSEPAWSPDGERIAFVSGSDLYTVDVDGGPPDHVLRERDETFAPQWSHDGRWLAFSPPDAETGLSPLDVVRPDGTGRRRLARDAEQFAWSPRDQTLLYVRAGDVYRVDADGTDRQRLTFDGPGWSFDRSLAWSPDGGQIAYVAPRLARGIRDPMQPTDVWVMNADGSDKHAVTRAFPTGGVNLYPDWIDGEPKARPVPVPAHFATLPAAFVLRTRQPIGGLAARGSVAVIEQGLGSATEFDNPPEPLLRWSPRHGVLDRVPVRGCGSATNPVISGARIAYVCDNSAVDLIARSVRVAAGGRTATLVDTRATHLVGAPFRSRLVHGLAGSGPSLVFGVAETTIPVVGGWRTRRTHVWRVNGGRRREIATFAGDAWVADADATHVAILRGRRAVLALSRDGRVVQRLAFRRNQVIDAALDRRSIVVLTGERLSSYELGSGRRERSWPAGGNGRVRRIASASDGVVAYVDGMAIHLLRVWDGRDVAVRLPADAAEPVYAHLTSAGLFYSYTDPRRLPAGRVVFVPRRALGR